MTATEARSKILEVVNYDPDTGMFRWAKTRKKCPVGKIAGSVRHDGYVTIRINGKRDYAHRLAWLIMMGEWPPEILDHADGNPTNNTWTNIRRATPAQNQQNRGMQANNSVGYKGVRRSGKRYFAGIQVNGEYHHLGTFDKPEIAYAAYCMAAVTSFGEFARLG